MFVVQKFVSMGILSPLPVIIILFIIGINNMWSRKFKSGFLLWFISGVIYLFSCEFFADPIIMNLEKKYPLVSEKQIEEGEIYVLLCGGIITDTLEGNTPQKNALGRIVKTVKMYNKNPKKIYISGGSPLQNRESESSVYKRELVLLGIPQGDIIIEEGSNNTKENGVQIKDMMRKEGIKSALLITSAVHMPRSMEVFKDEELEFYPVPCDFTAHKIKQNNLAYIPQFKVLKDLYAAFWEYIGMIYYKIRY